MKVWTLQVQQIGIMLKNSLLKKLIKQSSRSPSVLGGWINLLHPVFTFFVSNDERDALVAGGFRRTGVRVRVFSQADGNHHVLTANRWLLVRREQIIYTDKHTHWHSPCGQPSKGQIHRKDSHLVPGCERCPVHPAVEGSPLQTAGQKRRWNNGQVI